MDGFIEIPKDKVKDLVRKVYDMSVPVGLGHLHAKAGGLTDEEVDTFFRYDDPRFGESPQPVIRMDYVNGRQCKMTVFLLRHKGMEDRFFINDLWYDHTPDLLAHVGVVHDRS